MSYYLSTQNSQITKTQQRRKKIIIKNVEKDMNNETVETPKPDENPEQDRDCNRADQTAGKEPLPTGKRKNCAEERDEIERC